MPDAGDTACTSQPNAAHDRRYDAGLQLFTHARGEGALGTFKARIHSVEAGAHTLSWTDLTRHRGRRSTSGSLVGIKHAREGRGEHPRCRTAQQPVRALDKVLTR